MIKINLKPKDSGSLKVKGISESQDVGVAIEDEKELQKQGALRLFVIILFPLGLFAYEQVNIPELKDMLRNKSTQLSQLQEFNSKNANIVAEIKKLKEDEEKNKQRISVLEKLSKARLGEIKVLDLFQQIVPEKLWFTKLDFESQKVLISGYAVSDTDLTSFLDSLQKSIHFKEVNLLSSNEEILRSTSVKRFEISCLLERIDE